MIFSWKLESKYNSATCLVGHRILVHYGKMRASYKRDETRSKSEYWLIFSNRFCYHDRLVCVLNLPDGGWYTAAAGTAVTWLG